MQLRVGLLPRDERGAELQRRDREPNTEGSRRSGAAGTSQVMAYSIGAQAVILAFNLLLGVIAVFVLFGQVRFGAVRHEAHAPG